MYDLVAGIHCLKSSYVLSKTKALEHFPMLKKDKLVGAIVYYDGESPARCVWSKSNRNAFALLSVNTRRKM